ncbi:hypothetical protein [Clostridium saccharoperbutylacetonicum]|uniref:hypothetical protein n=1 Tax=Clostridium saccharoperbutylacetonicum TaxID=36745 RepID=UPI001F4CB356|nr:hypothetical protein [Clostridium saccharoperbutylacetonicum]NSB25137.1 hypothetical protein [Clostridium saccharoperbutylacetonicum]
MLEIVIIGIAALVTGISALAMHNSAAQSKSSSVPGLSALSEIGKIKDKLEKRLKLNSFWE